MRSRILTARRLLGWARDAALVLAVVLVVGYFQTRGHLREVPLPEVRLPLVSVQDPSPGAVAPVAPVALRDLVGKPTMLVVWSPWCGVCKVESANVSRVQRWVGDRARVVSIALGWEDVEDVRAYMVAQGVDYPVLLGDRATAQGLRVSAFPTVYFVGSDGRVRRSVTGYTTTVGLLARLLL